MGDEKKILKYEINDGKIVVVLDVDKDGEPSIELSIDIMEVISESISKISK